MDSATGFCLHSDKHLLCINHVPQTSWVCGIRKDRKREEMLRKLGQQGRSIPRLDQGFNENGMGHTVQGLSGSVPGLQMQ